MARSSDLLDEALGFTIQSDLSSSSCQGGGLMFLIEDCVETSGAFVIHHIIKRSLPPSDSSGIVIFVALSQPFSHHDKIMKKLGCNLAAHRNSNRFFFFDMLALKCSEGTTSGMKGLNELYGKILKVVQVVSASSQDNGRQQHITVVIEDFSLLEVAANGSSSHCLDFLHYCHSLTSEFGCSLVILNHRDIYNDSEQSIILHMEYLASVLIKAEPLATGLAVDVHGQLTVVNKRMNCSSNRLRNFQFKVKENGVECFYPGTCA